MSVTGSDLALFARDLALNTREFVADYVGKAIAGITDRFEQQIAVLKEVRAIPGPAGEPGPPGPPGRDAAEPDLVRIKADVRAEMMDALRADMLAMMRDLVREEVDRRISGVAMPRDGRDGKDADLTMVKALIDATSAGRDGKDGEQGPPGRDGASVTVDDLRPVVVAEVAKALAASPPREGKDGLPGRDADPEVTRALVDVAVAKAFEAVTPPKDGRDGKDGTSFTFGIGPPSFDGRSGDAYLDTKTGDLYQCR